MILTNKHLSWPGIVGRSGGQASRKTSYNQSVDQSTEFRELSFFNQNGGTLQNVELQNVRKVFLTFVSLRETNMFCS